MRDVTRRMWSEQDRHPGDRKRLFTALADSIPVETVLYPGSFVDIAPSFVFPDVFYVDSYRRAARFFDDSAGVDEIIEENGGAGAWRFLLADYTGELGLENDSFDLLVSLYAGFVSQACGRYLRPGGWLLVNPSHGDAAMASIDARFELVGVVQAHSGGYTVSDRNLDQYFVPRRPVEITPEFLHETGRGIAYTRSPFAYVFRKRGTRLTG